MWFFTDNLILAKNYGFGKKLNLKFEKREIMEKQENTKGKSRRMFQVRTSENTESSCSIPAIILTSSFLFKHYFH